MDVFLATRLARLDHRGRIAHRRYLDARDAAFAQMTATAEGRGDRTALIGAIRTVIVALEEELGFQLQAAWIVEQEDPAMSARLQEAAQDTRLRLNLQYSSFAEDSIYGLTPDDLDELATTPE
ncbi:hypothetical protein EV383_2827 [Pseudonocardia sediminis]|uniref:Uncharacterized protein n=1 Tax=Pseudonocardia sediminis TaxID=1397368 RepID=A0A4Q7V0D3_PSEST|nr:hypothetical protein [Pseudonocardia sediminis]RZT85939.1 hypothetical protein EV383_2827 [Pseudonocardia sediminis]